MGWRTALLALLPLLAVVVGAPVHAADYPGEAIYDTAVHPDEAAVNVSLVSDRWPDCTTLESTVADMFRLEGVADRTRHSDQERALAMWKWFRIMVSGTFGGGGYAYEKAPDGAPNPDSPGLGTPTVLVRDPSKILTVYGHQQCDGQGWTMVPLWRAAGYLAYDECTDGHTTAALRYRDDDGVLRFHSFDPQNRFYHWDPVHNRLSCWSIPVQTGHVFRHLVTPQHLHSLRTSLRTGETIQRNWANTGHLVPHFKLEDWAKAKADNYPGNWGLNRDYYAYKPGRTDGVYSAAGEEIQTLTAATDPAGLKAQLFDDSANTACSPPADGKATLHPADADWPAVFIYRLAPPYVAVDGTIEATLVKSADGDLCRLSMSCDGGEWQTLVEKKAVGVEKVTIDIGRAARDKKQPHLYTAYDIRIRAEFQAAGEARAAGMNDLKVTIYRMLNKRTLPNLMPGENVFRVNADKLPAGHVIKVTLRYEADGQAAPVEINHTVGRVPYYFAINAPFELRKISNYDDDFNNEAVRMVGYSMTLVGQADRPAAPRSAAPGSAATQPTGELSLPAREAEPKFQAAYPHPADMNVRRDKKPEAVETDPVQTSEFFPQSRVVLHDKDKMDALIAQAGKATNYAQHRIFQQLGDYPEAIDFLLEQLPNASIDGTLAIVKALAQIADPKAIDPLLAKWNTGHRRPYDPNGSPGGAPGARYIPDALAAIAVKAGRLDPRIVPTLVAPLKDCRFDFRLHVAHALGEVGPLAPADSENRKLAIETLKDLAKNDPVTPSREEATEALKKLTAPPRLPG